MTSSPEVSETGAAPSLAVGRGQFRPEVRGKFLFLGGQKFFVRGVTYGTFSPNGDGDQFPSREMVRRDFELIAANGINSVRTYTVPPRWLLDMAAENGLFVMIGLPWEQHITFLDEPGRAAAIERNVRASLKTCAGHLAILCYSIGNEIPASIVRWHGRKAVEGFLHRLYLSAKAEDPQALVTYVNFPTTEYLQLPFLDFVSFNVYLESQEKLQAYLARLQTLAGDRPLVVAEVGLDSRRNGEARQAAALDWQVRLSFASGCAGMFVFAWTDEWYRGGHDIDDWDFGLVARDRRPKSALRVVSRAFTEAPFPRDLAWPRISVVVCSYNGSRTIGETLEHLHHLDYPDYEVIVVDDGSTDATAKIADQPHVRLIRVKNGGLSRARNIGAEASTGEIVAYIDDDAYPDPHWLKYLASEYMADPKRAGVGGPNLPPPGDGSIAEAVAHAPGGPIHVLLSDRDAEHIPGCNCSFRRDRLLAIGGFDPEFRTAGDDVDVCWRLLANGWTLGFNPAALVWHHRRNVFKTYWKQQKGYGKAEALLERKFPEKYNALGHATWAGRLYGKGLVHSVARGWRIYHGAWNSAAFQSLYQRGPSNLQSLLQTPEWYFVIAALAALCALGLVWAPLQMFVPVLMAVVAVQIIQAAASARVSLRGVHSEGSRIKLFLLTALFYLIQPIARLVGRLNHGLTPWRRRRALRFATPLPHTRTLWSETWKPPECWLESIESILRKWYMVVERGGDFDNWDLQIRGGVLGSMRIRMAIEEHGSGKEMIKYRLWPSMSIFGLALVLVFAALALGAAWDENWIASAILGAAAAALALRKLWECSTAASSLFRAVQEVESGAKNE